MNKEFENQSLLEFPFPNGIKSYNESFPLETSVKYQIVGHGNVSYSQKWVGIIQAKAIEGQELSMSIEVTSTGTVKLTSELDSEAIPFSAVASNSDPLKFFNQLGLVTGSLLSDGSVTGNRGKFEQPKLGVFNASAYQEINLSYVFGLNTTRIKTFEVKCAPNSPEEEGICTPSWHRDFQ